MGAMLLIFTVFAVLCLLVAAEFGGRRLGVHTELTRKFVHLSVGTFVAFWPFFLSYQEIAALSLAFLFVILVSVRLRIFRSIHRRGHTALGEVLFALVIGILAFITSGPNGDWVFWAAMLFLSLGDGLAAVIGLAYGEGNQYKVLGRTKSIAGSLTFLIIAVIILTIYVTVSHASPGWLALVMLPVVAMVVENSAPHGMDNLMMPLLVALVLGNSF
jgi:phytol kinase